MLVTSTACRYTNVNQEKATVHITENIRVKRRRKKNRKKRGEGNIDEANKFLIVIFILVRFFSLPALDCNLLDDISWHWVKRFLIIIFFWVVFFRVLSSDSNWERPWRNISDFGSMTPLELRIEEKVIVVHELFIDLRLSTRLLLFFHSIHMGRSAPRLAAHDGQTVIKERKS